MNIDNLQGDTLFSYLRTNRESLLEAKLTSLALAEPITIAKEVNTVLNPSLSDLSNRDTLDVTVVCSTSWLCNSHMDVLTDKAFDKSIKVRGNTIPHIVDHRHEATAHVGDVKKVYIKEMPLRDLGYSEEGTTTVLLMDTTVRKDYNEDVFKFYANGKINQHSIGFTYQDIKFAVNSSHENDKVEKLVWDEFYPKVINKDVVDKRGYFWVVSEVDVKENSAVLFGSNHLTPTLTIASMKTDSPLGNIPSPVTQPIGNTMTLEEAQGKIISLTEELAKAKADNSLARLEATTNEKNRTLGILKAQATFGGDVPLQKAALSFIEKGIDTDTAIVSFEAIKEGLQKSSHVDTSGASLLTGTKEADSGLKTSFAATLDKALETMPKDGNLFVGFK